MDALSGSTFEEKYKSSTEDNETAQGGNAFSQSSEVDHSSSRVKGRKNSTDRKCLPLTG